MGNIIKKYYKLSYEQKVFTNTILSIVFSSLLIIGKFIVGIFSDMIMCVVALYSLFILLSKLQCILGLKNKKKSFDTRNKLISIFFFLAGLIYIFYMGRLVIFDIPKQQYNRLYSILYAFIAFLEIGLSIFGLFKVRKKGHFYRNIKLVNFVTSLTAILTIQIMLLSFDIETNTNLYNGFTGIAIGLLTIILAIYIYFAPKISIVDHEHNVYELVAANKNKIEIHNSELEVVLLKSKIYGNYLFKAKMQANNVDGYIIKENYFWKNLNIFIKILCIILSEILIFIYAIGALIYFIRTFHILEKLDTIMNENGFLKKVSE